MTRMTALLRPWPGLVFALFGLNMIVVAITVWASLGDPSFAIDPGYDVKAADWQTVADQQAANRRLGWRLEVLAPSAGAPLRMALKNRDGSPISGGRIDAVVFHHALASRRLEASLVESDPGIYTTDLILDRAGRWHVAFDAVHGHDRYAASLDFTAGGRD